MQILRSPMRPHNTVMPSSDVNARSGRMTIHISGTKELYKKLPKMCNDFQIKRSCSTEFIQDLTNPNLPVQVIVQNKDLKTETRMAWFFLQQLKAHINPNMGESGLISLGASYKSNETPATLEEEAMFDHMGKIVREDVRQKLQAVRVQIQPLGLPGESSFNLTPEDQKIIDAEYSVIPTRAIGMIQFVQNHLGLSPPLKPHWCTVD
jgi:hypothetical protein